MQSIAQVDALCDETYGKPRGEVELAHANRVSSPRANNMAAATPQLMCLRYKRAHPRPQPFHEAHVVASTPSYVGALAIDFKVRDGPVVSGGLICFFGIGAS